MKNKNGIRCLLALTFVSVSFLQPLTVTLAEDSNNNTVAAIQSPNANSTASSDSTGDANNDNSSSNSSSNASSNNTSSSNASNNATSSSSTSSSSNAPLQAGVQVIQISLEKLQDLGMDIKHMLKASSSLYDEVTIQPVSLITEPEVVGFGTVINIPIGTMPVGPPAPPKKERLDLVMNQLNPIIRMMKSDVDAFNSGKRKLDLSDDTRAELKPIFDTWILYVTDLDKQLDDLESLTQGPKYDNGAIAQVAQSIQADAQKLEKARRTIYKTLQKEAKREKKNK